MERLDVNFVNRYLRALDCYLHGEAASKSWVFAFNCAPQWPPIVLQHLLLGMNAHINLDLGAAADETCLGTELAGLKRDFDEINNILAAMVGGVRYQLSQISPWMRLLDLVGARTQDAIINFSIDRARDFAWSVAERLAPLGPEEAEREIERLDVDIELLAKLIRSPGVIISLANSIIRVSEVRSVPRVIEILS